MLVNVICQLYHSLELLEGHRRCMLWGGVEREEPGEVWWVGAAFQSLNKHIFNQIAPNFAELIMVDIIELLFIDEVPVFPLLQRWDLKVVTFSAYLLL